MSTDSIVLWPELVKLARRAARKFRLNRNFHIEPETHPRAFRWGNCDEFTDGTFLIKLRVHRLNSKRPLSRRIILHTLAHELAHLAPGMMAHNGQHRALTQRIYAWLGEQCR